MNADILTGNSRHQWRVVWRSGFMSTDVTRSQIVILSDFLLTQGKNVVFWR